MAQEPTNAEVLAAVDALRRDIADLAPLLARAAVDADMQQHVRHITALRSKSPTQEIMEFHARKEARAAKRLAGGTAIQPASGSATG